MTRFTLVFGAAATWGLLCPMRVLGEGPSAPPGPPAAARASPCVSPEHRQFDFWIGDWEVRNPAGKTVGHNHIVAIHNGCALEENWTGNGDSTGTSLNSYDAPRRQWHQTWVDNGGDVLKLDGGFVDGSMILRGETPATDSAGGVSLHRISWAPQQDGRVRQHWQTSTDGGKTWSTAFDGMYTKLR